MTPQSRFPIRWCASLIGFAMALPAQTTLPWTEVAQPSARHGHALASNVGGQGVILFGGFETTSAQTWILDGTSWTRTGWLAGPLARSGAAMAFDAARNVVVLFGGASTASTGLFGDTWEWNGAAWTQRANTGPAARTNGVMAYDQLRQRAVLFGGSNGNNTLADTWEWNGVAWTQLAAVGPMSRHRHAMAFDGVGVILFGGQNSPAPGFNSLVPNETWRLAAAGTGPATWSSLAPVPAPPADQWVTMSGNNTNQVVMNGGEFSPNARWSWNGTTWSPLTAASWGVRIATAAAYDFARSEHVVFGGRPFPSPTVLGDTWRGTSLAMARLAFAPSARAAAAMDEDRVSGAAVLHGGLVGTSPSSETWTFAAQQWTRATPPGPARSGHTITWDPAQQRLTMFGGSAPAPSAETLVWDRATGQWQLLATLPSAPSARWGHAAASVQGLVPGIVMFGGTNGTLQFGDTWGWTGGAWIPLSTAGPSAREGAALAAEPGGTTVLLFGGKAGAVTRNDTWRFTTTTGAWTQLQPATTPPARFHHRMVLDPSRGIVMVGGFDTAPLADAWLWDDTALEWLPTTAPPFAGRHRHACSNAAGELLVVGGDTASAQSGETWTAPPRTGAVFNAIGSGCGASPAAAPSLSCTQLPYLGELFQLRITGLPTSAFPFLGFDYQVLNPPLPLCAGCDLLVQPVAWFAVANIAGTATIDRQVPLLPLLIGASWYGQGFALDASYSCFFGVALTNAAQITIGGR
jgi:hypothetical protein